MGYGAPRLIEVEMVQRTILERIEVVLGGHLGPEIGKFGTCMATKWHLKPSGKDI